MISLALVDDAAALRRLIGTYLAMQGFEILLETSSGEALLDALEVAERLPDLCLLDANMPGISGCGTAAALREKYPSIRIMAYSFFDEHDRPDHMLDCGAHHYVSKDAPPAAVRDALLALHASDAGT